MDKVINLPPFMITSDFPKIYTGSWCAHMDVYAAPFRLKMPRKHRALCENIEHVMYNVICSFSLRFQEFLTDQKKQIDQDSISAL